MKGRLGTKFICEIWPPESALSKQGSLEFLRAIVSGSRELPPEFQQVSKDLFGGGMPDILPRDQISNEKQENNHRNQIGGQ